MIEVYKQVVPMLITLFLMVGFIFNLIGAIKDGYFHSLGFFGSIGVFLLVVLVTILSPLLILYGYKVMDILSDKNKNEFSRLNMHTLTEDNKTTLRQLYFNEGEYTSITNFVYEGFKKKIGSTIIYLAYDGHGCVWGPMTEEVMHYVRIINNLPSDLEGEQENGTDE